MAPSRNLLKLYVGNLGPRPDEITAQEQKSELADVINKLSSQATEVDTMRLYRKEALPPGIQAGLEPVVLFCLT
jgi:hypothetical protein